MGRIRSTNKQKTRGNIPDARWWRAVRRPEWQPLFPQHRFPASQTGYASSPSERKQKTKRNNNNSNNGGNSREKKKTSFRQGLACLNGLSVFLGHTHMIHDRYVRKFSSGLQANKYLRASGIRRGRHRLHRLNASMTKPSFFYNHPLSNVK